MNSYQSDSQEFSPSTIGRDTDKPAIGAVVTTDNSDAIIRMVIRARRNGYPVFLTHYNDSSIEAISFAKDLGARIVAPEQSNPSDRSLTKTLSKRVQRAGFSGLVIHRDVDKYIDYDRSISALESADAYSIDAISKSASTRSRTLVAIPAYNEGHSIASVVYRARHHADEVLVVDDGSDDDTGKRAEEAGAIVLEHRRNRGYGATLRTIFREANRRGVDHLVTLDGDGQHDPDDIPKLLATQRESEAELVIGNRFMDDAETNLPLYRSLGLKVVNFLTNLSIGSVRGESRVDDTQSGFRAYSPEAVRTLAADDSIGTGMDASTDILYHAHSHGYRIEEVGTGIDYDVENGSSQNPITHGYALVRNILGELERRRPMTVLGTPGLVSLFVSFALFYFMFENYSQTGTLPLGLALFASMLILAGIFSCITAIVLHSLNMYLDRGTDRLEKENR